MNTKKTFSLVSALFIAMFGIVVFVGGSGTMDAKGKGGNGNGNVPAHAQENMDNAGSQGADASEAKGQNRSERAQEARANKGENRNERANEGGKALGKCDTADAEAVEVADEEVTDVEEAECKTRGNNASERGQKARDAKGENRSERGQEARTMKGENGNGDADADTDDDVEEVEEEVEDEDEIVEVDIIVIDYAE